MYERYGKRVLDLALAVVAVAALSPILALVGLAILIEDGRPVIYCQHRTGRSGRGFVIFKFRSMPVNTAVATSATMEAAAVTRVGRVTRRTNVDELPQLFNILRGDMSIVGPRPPLDSQQTLLEHRRSGPAWDCRPGLTGLAQVNSFDAMTEEEKAVLDTRYARRVTLIGDLKIIAQTVRYLFSPPPTY